VLNCVFLSAALQLLCPLARPRIFKSPNTVGHKLLGGDGNKFALVSAGSWVGAPGWKGNV